jgi:hypothetical protein
MNGSLGKGGSNNTSLKNTAKPKEDLKSSLREGKGSSTTVHKQIPASGSMSNTAKSEIGGGKNTFGEALKNKQSSGNKAN